MYIFKNIAPEQIVSVTVKDPDEQITWKTLTDRYFEFLLGCGFVIDKDSFKEFLGTRAYEWISVMEKKEKGKYSDLPGV